MFFKDLFGLFGVKNRKIKQLERNLLQPRDLNCEEFQTLYKELEFTCTLFQNTKQTSNIFLK